MKRKMEPMKYKVGDFVTVLVAKDVALEGDIGVIDAVHSSTQSYTVGFYAAEDCMVGSARFYEEELSPYEKKDNPFNFSIGDQIKTLVDNQNIPAGSVGEIISIFEKEKGIAVKFEILSGAFPTILPYSMKDVERFDKVTKLRHD